MTAAPGDALAAPPLAMLLDGFFRTNQRARNHPSDPRRTSPVSASGSDDRSSLKCMGIMSRLQEQLKPSSHSTIALLAETSS
jgi:hypothetical protein